MPRMQIQIKMNYDLSEKNFAIWLKFIKHTYKQYFI